MFPAFVVDGWMGRMAGPFPPRTNVENVRKTNIKQTKSDRSGVTVYGGHVTSFTVSFL